VVLRKKIGPFWTNDSSSQHFMQYGPQKFRSKLGELVNFHRVSLPKKVNLTHTSTRVFLSFYVQVEFFDKLAFRYVDFLEVGRFP